MNAIFPHTAELSLQAPAEVEMVIAMRCPSTRWDRPGAESATVRVRVDGMDSHHVVVFMGDQRFEYRSMLGRLNAGKHSIELHFDPDLSSADASEPEIDDVRFHVYTPEHPLYLVYRHCPIVFGRASSYRSDVPLLMGYEQSVDERGRTVIRYTLIFSNEDGGTNTPALMARWGRTTDIEWVYRVSLDAQHNVVEEHYHGDGHTSVRFCGQRQDAHPVIKVASRCHWFVDSGWGAFRFFMSPLELPGGDVTQPVESLPREQLMDRHPWTYRIIALELIRERKLEAHANPAEVAVSDLRNYVYIGYQTRAPLDQCDTMHGYPVHRTMELQTSVRLAGDAAWYHNDHGRVIGGIRKIGWTRTAIELPPGKAPLDIEAIRLTAYRIAPGPFQLTIARLTPVFMLDAEYIPTPSMLDWNGEMLLDEEHAEVVLTMR